MRFFKGKLKPAPEPEKKPEEKIPNMPELTPGMKVEVLTTENHLLFVGRLTLPETGGAHSTDHFWQQQEGQHPGYPAVFLLRGGSGDGGK